MDDHDDNKDVPQGSPLNLDAIFGTGFDDLADVFNGTISAQELEPLPRGEYLAQPLEASLERSNTGKPYYKMRFTVAVGEHAGRRVTMKWYLSEAAAPYSKRHLAKLGLCTLGQLKRGEVPAGPVRVRVTIHEDDNGNRWNNVEAVFPCAPSPAQATSAPPEPTAPVRSPETPPAAAPVTVDDLPADLRDDELL